MAIAATPPSPSLCLRLPPSVSSPSLQNFVNFILLFGGLNIGFCEPFLLCSYYLFVSFKCLYLYSLLSPYIMNLHFILLILKCTLL